MIKDIEKVRETAYKKFRAYKGGSGSRFDTPGLTGKEIAGVLLGDFNYQIENGGIFQWWENRYAFEKAPNGNTPLVAIAALAARFRDIDPEVADSIIEAMNFIYPVPELEKKSKGMAGSLSYLDGDDEDDEDEYFEDSTPLQEHFDGDTVTNGYCDFDQDRRIDFMDKVVASYPDHENPFEAAFDFKAGQPTYKAPDVKYPDVHVRLVGEDGNADLIIARTRRALERARVPRAEIEAYTAEARSGDYDKVLSTTMKWVNYDPPEPEQESEFRI